MCGQYTVSVVDWGQDLEFSRWAKKQVLREVGEIGKGDHQASSYRCEEATQHTSELWGVIKYCDYK